MIPDVKDIQEKHPDTIEQMVAKGLERLADEHLYKYGKEPEPGCKYVFNSWEFINVDKHTLVFIDEVMSRIAKILEDKGYVIRKGLYEHRSIGGIVYDTSPQLIINVPIRGKDV